MNADLATIVPTLTRTTPFLGEFATSGASNVTYLPILSSSTIYANASSSTEYYESTEIYGVSRSPQPGGMSTGTSTFHPPRAKTRKPGGGSGRKNKSSGGGGGTRKPKFKRATQKNQYSFKRTKTTDPPEEENTQPDWSKYPSVSEEEEEDENFVLKIGQNGNGFFGKSSTRGDIPVKEDPVSTTTTTEMPPSTTFIPEPTTPESLDKFLTNVMAIVTMVRNII